MNLRRTINSPRQDKMKRTIKNAFLLLGIDIRRARPKPAPRPANENLYGGNQWSFENFNAIELDEDLLVDIGVAGGTPELYARFPSCDLVLIEPISDFAGQIKMTLPSRDYVLINKAIGRSRGKIELNYNPGKPNQTSMFLRTMHDGNTREVEIDTLDSVLAGIPGKRLVVKIDVEGAELEVLAGAEDTLKRSVCVFIEVNMGFGFADLRNPLPEVDQVMKNAGFVLFAIMDAVREGDQLHTKVTKADFCYVRRDTVAA